MTDENTQAVAYYRVSTKKQGADGLGIDAQKDSVQRYAKANGLTIGRSFTEVESGKRSDRPELAKALAHCRRTGARLIVAKLDRLSRNVAFLSSLMEAKVDFTACDNPTANRLTLHILAAVAENEVKAISDRTKAALQAAKRRGVKLGSAREGHWEGIEDKRLAGAAEGRKVAARVNHERGREAIADLLPTMTSLRNQGKTYQEIADALNADGATTSRGNPWNAMLARNSMIRFGA